MIIQSRRAFLTGIGAGLIAAPAIVRVSSLMPLRARATTITFDDYLRRILVPFLEREGAKTDLWQQQMFEALAAGDVTLVPKGKPFKQFSMIGSNGFIEWGKG